MSINTVMPALALRGLTIFPSMELHFDVGRAASVHALEEAMDTGSPIFLVTQRTMEVEDPGPADLYPVGTISTVKQLLRLPENNVRVMVEGVARGRLVDLVRTAPSLQAEVAEIPAVQASRLSARDEAAMRESFDLLQQYAAFSNAKGSDDLLLHLVDLTDPGYFSDYVAQNVPMRPEAKQVILEELRPGQRIQKLYRILRREMEVLELEHSLRERVGEQVARTQRDFVLREQLKVLKRELGETDGDDNEIGDYRRRIEAAHLPDDVQKKLLKETARLEKQPFGSAEGALLRSYLDICLELPWAKKTKDRLDVARARKQLDADHFGLEKVKERVLEFLAVKQLSPDLKGQVLCLVGPPGVGKTSVAMSVAAAMNRKLVRVSLGGVHDEAEIRGHRKTYIGAMPGRIIAAINQAGSCNPVIVLDEIDKLGESRQGDPASALLEVLDSEQNSAFRDHFLELPFDLSEVLFITTANTTDTIPRPLLDRMELIELGSYTDEEKLQIAKRHLLPVELKRHGLQRRQVHIEDAALRKVICEYTKESGVRVLRRELSAICRKCAVKIAEKNDKRISITQTNLEEFLGVPKYLPEVMATEIRVGVVNGLAWTRVGGELLEVEVAVIPGTGKLELTGNLGDVMKESAHAALTYIRGSAGRWGLSPDFYQKNDIHIHFPEAAVPKDGPSAGIAITTAMLSALTKRPVRGGIAMTGEVTLRGRVLAIGGLREKTMAALRSGIHTVLIPAENMKDLENIDQTVRTALRFIPVEQVDAVLEYALLDRPVQEQEPLLMSAPEPLATNCPTVVRQ